MFSNSFYFFRSEFSEIPLWIKIVQLISLIAVWLIIKNIVSADGFGFQLS